MERKQGQNAINQLGLLYPVSGQVGSLVFQKNGIVRCKPLHIKKYTKKTK